jgi:hypothetical protein
LGDHPVKLSRWNVDSSLEGNAAMWGGSLCMDAIESCAPPNGSALTGVE